MNSEAAASSTLEAIEDRAIGALVGLAVGDALGTTLEFKPRDSYQPLTGIVGGGPFGLEAGEWTDDTAMALALADGLARPGDFDEQDLLARFVDWWHHGAYSCTGTCFDIGMTTRRALTRWLAEKIPHCGSSNPATAGNGSLMRLAPVAIRYWNDRAKLRDVAARQSKTTHAAQEAVAACVAFAEILADAIEGRPKQEVLRGRFEPYAGAIGSIMSGRWRMKDRAQIGSSGYVAHSLEAALWCAGGSDNYRAAVLMAANLGDDADTTAAVTGQLAGALYGVAGIQQEWLHILAWKDAIESKAALLFQLSLVRT
jgi:ADP-ribosyl-[dinitrogen reductase] hydrolase